MNLTSSQEEYLKTIYILSKTEKEIRVTDIAKILEITKPRNIWRNKTNPRRRKNSTRNIKKRRRNETFPKQDTRHRRKTSRNRSNSNETCNFKKNRRKTRAIYKQSIKPRRHRLWLWWNKWKVQKLRENNSKKQTSKRYK